MRQIILSTESDGIFPLGELISKPYDALRNGDVILWRSQMNGNFEIHTVHSFVGYGVKTYTNYDDVDGSSVIVNLTGIVGVLQLYRK